MYIPADESRELYNVYGSFYNIDQGSYRNALDIVTKDICKTDLLNKPVDAIVIMLNPGSSYPLSSEKIQLSKDISFTEAWPDKAQYQIMSLMKHHSWNHVRILNLSDIRDPSSNNFLKTISTIDNHDHSVFSDNRSEEFEKLYNIKQDGHTILGWTLNPEISNIADLALEKGLINPIGLQHSTLKNLFRYPSPPRHNKKIEWLEQISDKIKKAA